MVLGYTLYDFLLMFDCFVAGKVLLHDRGDTLADMVVDSMKNKGI